MDKNNFDELGSVQLSKLTQLSKLSKVAQWAKAVDPQSSDADELAKVYFKWLKDKNSFQPVGDVTTEDELKRSAYKIRVTMQGMFFDRIKPKTAELYKFKSGPMEEVLSEIDRFWSLKDDYKKLGLLYTRGILMYGPPGSGKTSIINQVVDMITAKGDVVFYGTQDLAALKAGIQAFRGVEKDRKLVIVLEDADEFVKYDEQPLLHLLDGQDATDGTLFLGSTNYIDRFPQRLLRSGRFDKKVYVPQPPYEGRLAYLKNKLLPKKVETAKEIERLANETDGMSFGDMAELVTAVYALKEPVEDVLKRLKEGTDKTGDAPADSTSASRFYFPLGKGVSVAKASGVGSGLDLDSLAKVVKPICVEKKNG